MEGIIVNFKSSRTRQAGNQMIVVVNGVETREKAKPLVGKKVTWLTSSKKEIKGEVRSAHGNKGALRILFEKGMPGQAIGTKISFS